MSQTYQMFLEEKGEEVMALNRARQEVDIKAIIERRTNGETSQKELRKISQIRNRTILPGKKWFMQQKPGVYI
jgi:hypothetical protein